MPTDQNNGVNPNQNPTTSNASTSTNTNQNGWDFDFNLDWVVLENDTGKDENLSVDNLFDWWDSVSNEPVNNINNEWEKPVDLHEKNAVEAPVWQLTEAVVEQWVQDVVSQNMSSEAEQSTQNFVKDDDDWLLQEDQAVQESENNWSEAKSQAPETNNEPVENTWVDLSGLADGLQSQLVESESPVESVASNNEPVENTWVDLSGLADGLQSEPVEPESPVESVVSNNEPVENTWVDLSGLADGLQSEPVEPESPVESVVSNNEPVENTWVDLSGLAEGLQSQPVEPETPVESVVSNNEPVESTWVDLSGLADGLQSQSVEPIEWNIKSDVQSENIVSNTASVSDTLANVGEISSIVDNGWTELDWPEIVSVDAPVVTPVDAPVNESVENMWIPADSLTIENVWTPVVQDKSGNMVSDTWDFSGKKDGYVPNESEFQKMSTLLDGAKPWHVEIPSEMNTPIQSQWDETQTQEDTKWVFNLDYVVSSLQDSEKNRQNNMMWNNNAVVNNIPENSVVESNIPVDTGAANVAENIPSSVENGPSVQPVVNGVEMVQNNMPQWQWNVAQTQVVETIPQAPIQWQVAPTETMPVQEENSPKKFHNGHTGLIIVLVVIWLLWLICFLMYKMYPDVVSSILWKNNISIEYQNNTSSVILSWEDENFGLTWDAVEELTWDTELWELLTPDENLTWNDDLMVNKDNQSSWWGLDDVLDPDTLAALLWWNDWNSNIENTWETVSEIHDSPSNDSGDIDTYKDLWLLLDESNSDKTEILKRLNDYKAQGIIYQDRWTENDNQGAYKYGTYIVKKATAMIESIETTGEMDMNEIEKNFNTFDGYLSKLEALK